MTTRQLQNMHHVLESDGLLIQFINYTPPQQTGYAFDRSPMIKTLKCSLNEDKHSMASFSICCLFLKKWLIEQDNHI